jgi:hypothetical protein
LILPLFSASKDYSWSLLRRFTLEFYRKKQKETLGVILDPSTTFFCRHRQLLTLDPLTRTTT